MKIYLAHNDFPWVNKIFFLEPFFVTTLFQFWIRLHIPRTVWSVQIRSFFWSVFSRIRTEYEDLRSKSPYSVRIRENTDQKNSAFGYFSHSDRSHYKLDLEGISYTCHPISITLLCIWLWILSLWNSSNNSQQHLPLDITIIIQ